MSKESSKERESGYYRVKLHNHEDWTIAHYVGDNCWFVTGSTYCYEESDFYKIGTKVEMKK